MINNNNKRSKREKSLYLAGCQEAMGSKQIIRAQVGSESPGSCYADDLPQRECLQNERIKNETGCQHLWNSNKGHPASERGAHRKEF